MMEAEETRCLVRDARDDVNSRGLTELRCPTARKVPAFLLRPA